MSRDPEKESIAMGVKFTCKTPTVSLGGAPHYMQTNASVSDTGQLVAVTHTFSHNTLGGFHGGVYAALVDANGVTIAGGATDVHTFGVDGTWVGNSDRTDTWSYQFPTNLFDEAHNIVVVQQWNPQWLQSLANIAKLVGELIQELAQNGGEADEGTESDGSGDDGNGGDILRNHPAFGQANIASER